MEAVDVDNVTKEYDGLKALDCVTFQVGRGELALLLGPNGAGKTTLLRCMLGLIHFEGEIRVLGLDVKRQGKEARKLIGYQPQDVNLYSDLTCTQLLDFFSDLRGITVTLEETLGQVGLLEKAEARVGSLSRGMRQRLSLALALMGDPEVFLLDEPFNNLDIKGRIGLMNTLRSLRERKKTIIVSLHSVGGVLTAADKVVVLSGGKLLRLMHPSELAARMSPTFKIHFRADRDEVENLPIAVDLSPTGWATATSSDLYKVLKALAESGIEPGRIVVEEPGVDELILRLSSEAE